MKIDRSKLKKSSSEVPADCKVLIESLIDSNAASLSETATSIVVQKTDFLNRLKKIDTWTYGKCELLHWVDVLDICDEVLEAATTTSNTTDGDIEEWLLLCDRDQSGKLKELLLWTLHFTTLLIEHSFSRHLYSSMEHLTTLLSSSDLDVILAVLNLLYMFSKRSNFITRLAQEKRQILLNHLTYLAASWGGKDNGFGLSKCCSDDPIESFPESATSLHFEFTPTDDEMDPEKKKLPVTIHVVGVDKLGQSPAYIMMDLLQTYKVPKDMQMLLFTYLRLAHSFSNFSRRLKCVQARLQALSVLIYSNQLTDNIQSLLYGGLLEELVELLEITPGSNLMEIKAAALKALTSIIHLDRNPNFPKLNTIIAVTGAASYHGFLPVLVRTCIGTLTQAILSRAPTTGKMSSFPQPLATALFSFLYHLASYEAGGEALVSCGMMESLLKVIQWPSTELDHITFVTRAVRVIDLITNLDMLSFQTHGGLVIFIERLHLEVVNCRQHQPFEIHVARSDPDTETMEIDQIVTTNYSATKKGLTCLPQRAALLKSMLNFLKKAIQDPAFSDSIRHMMEGALPDALKHIISNAEYYGASLFLLATDVVTAYVFQEPSLLSSLQDKGLTDVVLHALLVKDVPATREVLGSLPNVFSALCLNARGLAAFVACQPFERLFKVLLSPDYLPAMRRRRSSDPLGDTASNLGNAMDELMRHQPSLKQSATAAIVRLLEEICNLGRNPKYHVCWKSQSGKMDHHSVPSSSQHREPTRVEVLNRRPSNTNEGGGGSSDDEEEEDEEPSTSNQVVASTSAVASAVGVQLEKEPVPLVDYIHNVMKFVDAILSNNSTDDHCREFVAQKGLIPLMGILGLPNLPIDFPVHQACQAVAASCKSILNLAHEPQVLRQGLLHLHDVLINLEPLHTPLDAPGGSVLLRELADTMPVNSFETATNNPTLTPLLHNMSAAHAYIQMFVHVCRTGQSDIRIISVSLWGSELGLRVLRHLSRLYTSLVWESTILLALCSEESFLFTEMSEFGRADMDKLAAVPATKQNNVEIANTTTTLSPTCSGASIDSNSSVTVAMENLSTESPAAQTLNGVDVEMPSDSLQNRPSISFYHQLRQIKPLLSGSSRLGRALAELFALLVKLCVGSPLRQRSRGQQIPASPSPPTPSAQAIGGALTRLLANGLSWQPPSTAPFSRFRLTFYICSVGFTVPMLFDERKYPYHLMLMKFVAFGGQRAFFKAFEWAVSTGQCDGNDQVLFPPGTGEFFDAWLLLLEKMVDPRALFESPHTLPSSTTTKSDMKFNPVDYLLRTNRLAFKSIMNLWNKKPPDVYGARMSDSILSIMCHILKGQTIIAERMTATNKASATSNTAPSDTDNTSSTSADDVPSADEPAENSRLQLLIDMGFQRELCLEAIQVTTTLDQATDYILSGGSNHITPLQQVSNILGLDTGGSSSRSGASNGRLSNRFSRGTRSNEQDELLRAIIMSLGEGETIDKTVNGIDDDDNGDIEENAEEITIVYRKHLEAIDEFIQSAAMTGSLLWLKALPNTVHKICDLWLAIFGATNSTDFKQSVFKQLMADVCASLGTVDASTGAAAAALVHLFTLLLEECKVVCISVIQEANLVPLMLQLLETYRTTLTTMTELPVWLTPILVFLDRHEKVVLGLNRRLALVNICTDIWKWFDISAGKWQMYQAANNHSINEAFWAGESSVRFVHGRRKYLIQFGSMMQSNEDTGNRRPVMLTVKADDSLTITKDFVPPKALYTRALSGLDATQRQQLLEFCVFLFSHRQLTPDALNAILRLSLVLTQDYTLALHFARMGGFKLILELQRTTAFAGHVSLIALVVRHIIEDPDTLRYTINKVIRAATTNSNPSASKELHYLLRMLAPAVCRNPDIFCDVAREILRVDLSLLNKRGQDEDHRLLIKSLPGKNSHICPPLKEAAREIISDLLGFLVWSDEADASKVTPPLLTKTSVCRLLAELIKSYPGCAKFITDYVYVPSEDTIKEEMPALAFLLDSLLNTSQSVPAKSAGGTEEEFGGMIMRILLAAIGGCNQQPDAQSALVTEVKVALSKIVSRADSTDKHVKLQTICGLISTLIDGCPPTTLGCNQSFQKNSSGLTTANGGLNNIVKLMLKRGLISDLALIMHSLDFSCTNAHMAHTINAILKPLETLSRIVNQPSPLAPGRLQLPVKPRATNTTTSAEEVISQAPPTTDPISNSEATRAQGDENMGGIDAEEATELDVSTAAESIEPNSESHLQTIEETDAVEFLDMMDQLLENQGYSDELVENSGQPSLPNINSNDIGNRRRNNTSTDHDYNHQITESEHPSVVVSEGNDDLLEDAAVIAMTLESERRNGAERIGANDGRSEFEDEEEVIDDDEEDEDEDDEADDDEEEDEDDDDDEGDDDDFIPEDQDAFDMLEETYSEPSQEDFDLFIRVPQAVDISSGNNGRSQFGTGSERAPTTLRPINLPLWSDIGFSNGSGGVVEGSNNVAANLFDNHLAASGATNGSSLYDEFGSMPFSQVTASHPMLMAGSGRTTSTTLNAVGNNGSLGNALVNASAEATAANTNSSSRSGARNLQRNRGFRGFRGYFHFGGGANGGNNMNSNVHHNMSNFLGTNPHEMIAQGLRRGTPLLVDFGFALMESLENEIAEFGDSNGVLASGANRAALSTIPSALNRWSDESRVVDGDSHHDAVTALKPFILEVIQQIRLEELEHHNATIMKRMVDEQDRKLSSVSSSPNNSAFTSDEVGVGLSSNESNNATTAAAIATTATESNCTFSSSQVAMTTQSAALAESDNDSSINLPTIYNSLLSSNDTTSSALNDQYLNASDVTAQAEALPSVIVENSLPDAVAPLSPSPEQTQRPLSYVVDHNLVTSRSNVMETASPPTALEAAHVDFSAIMANMVQTSSNNVEPQPGTSREPIGSTDFSSILGDIDVPEGVDPSFLAALPEDMRQEVIDDQRRLQGIRRRAQQTAALSGGVGEVNPEFLAALPPNIQEEVLAQQRIEQQRQASNNPQEPVDPGEFLQNLPTSLRQTVLADMEDSQMAALPAELAAEAQTLRREYEQRTRGVVHERFFNHINHASASTLSSILRNTVSRLGTQYVHPSSRELWRSQVGRSSSVNFLASNSSSPSSVKMRGRLLLDNEGLSCLIIIIFMDDAKINTSRLHRILRNLCYHTPTRHWIIRCLLSILEKCNNEMSSQLKNKDDYSSTPHWLSISMDAALGFRANVFRLGNHGSTSLTIHPGAAVLVCRHVLETLVSLAKCFRFHFMPIPTLNDDEAEGSESVKPFATDFWDTLMRLDVLSCAKSGGVGYGKSSGGSVGKTSIKNDKTSFEEAMLMTDTTSVSTVSNSAAVDTFNASPFGQLLVMLSSPVIRRSSLLTDKLLRLLSLISMEQSEMVKKFEQKNVNTNVSSNKINYPIISTSLLKLAVDVLTSKSCSEEGMEDVTALLHNLSSGPPPVRNTILNLLLESAKELAKVVKQNIIDLETEIQKCEASFESSSSSMASANKHKHVSKGFVVDRFTNETVVLSAPSKVIGGGSELQLPTMNILTHKTSSQAFFLRVLKVIIQLREAAVLGLADKKTASSTDLPDPVENKNMEFSKPLSSELDLHWLWDSLSDCLKHLSDTPDHHAVLVLQSTVEAFFLVHAAPTQPSQKNKKTQVETRREQLAHIQDDVVNLAGSVPVVPVTSVTLPNLDTQKFLAFADKHRTVLNQILRQSTTHLADGPFAVLVDHTKVLDFDIKRRYFRMELDRMDEGVRREDLAVHVRRENVFEESFRELHRRSPEEWKNRFYIVFEGEEGQDAGGLLREWYVIISREIFNPMYALFKVSPGDRTTYMIYESSQTNHNHLDYFKFVGHVIAKAIYDNKLLECYFTRSFYKHILAKPVKYTDMESEDYAFYKGMEFLSHNSVSDLGYELTFSTEIREFGVTEVRDLIPDGRNIVVTNDNKMEYLRLVCHMKMTGAIRKQLAAFLEGFYSIIPRRLISIFNEQELELLLSGLPTIDIDDLKANTEYHKYQVNSLQIIWFWQALRSFDQTDKAKFMQFVTGSSKVPLNGFAALEGMNGAQKFQIHRDDRSTERLPSAHTCFNQLDLPAYETFDKLKSCLLKAIQECSEGFGFA